MEKQNQKKDRYHISLDVPVSPLYGKLGNAKIRTYLHFCQNEFPKTYFQEFCELKKKRKGNNF